MNPPKYILYVGTSEKIKKPITPTKIKDEYSKGEVTATSAYLAAWDINKCPSEPIIPKVEAAITWPIVGIIKSLGKKTKDVISKAKE